MANPCSVAKRRLPRAKPGACSIRQRIRPTPTSSSNLQKTMRRRRHRNIRAHPQVLIPTERRLNITMTIETMAREFRYEGLRLPDPNSKLTVDEVRAAFSATDQELATT